MNKNTLEGLKFCKTYGNNDIWFSKILVDVCGGDLTAGILLSQLIYGFSSAKLSEKKVQTTHKGKHCLVKRRSDWFDQCRLSERQYDRAINVIKKKGFVTTEIHKCHIFQGETATYIFLNENKLYKSIELFLEKNNEEQNLLCVGE